MNALHRIQDRPGRALPPVGRRFGAWQVVATYPQRSGRHNGYELACVRCGARIGVVSRYIARLPECDCDPALPETPQTEGVVDHWTSWEDDDRCWYVVAHHPEGLSHREIAELMDVSINTVMNIERAALEKLRASGALSRDDLAELLGTHEEDAEGDVEGSEW